MKGGKASNKHSTVQWVSRHNTGIHSLQALSQEPGDSRAQARLGSPVSQSMRVNQRWELLLPADSQEWLPGGGGFCLHTFACYGNHRTLVASALCQAELLALAFCSLTQSLYGSGLSVKKLRLSEVRQHPGAMWRTSAVPFLIHASFCPSPVCKGTGLGEAVT